MIKGIIQKKKDICKEIYKNIRDIFILHPLGMTGFVLVVLFFFALLFCWLGCVLETGGYLGPWNAYLHLYNEWSAHDGLSLMCGYMGVAATIILGLVTLRFSIKVDNRELIGRSRNLRIRKIAFFDMYEDFVPQEMRYPDSHKYQFLLKLELETKQSDFTLLVDSVEWGRCDEKFETSSKEFQKFNECAIHVAEAANTTIWIYFNELDQGENSWSYFYHLWQYEPLTMKKQLWDRSIRMKMKMEEKIWMKRQKPKRHDAIFEMVFENNSPQRSDEKNILLHLISHKIELIA